MEVTGWLSFSGLVNGWQMRGWGKMMLIRVAPTSTLLVVFQIGLQASSFTQPSQSTGIQVFIDGAPSPLLVVGHARCEYATSLESSRAGLF